MVETIGMELIYLFPMIKIVGYGWQENEIMDVKMEPY